LSISLFDFPAVFQSAKKLDFLRKSKIFFSFWLLFVIRDPFLTFFDFDFL